jgi:hypothetical protein
VTGPEAAGSLRLPQLLLRVPLVLPLAMMVPCWVRLLLLLPALAGGWSLLPRLALARRW